MHVKVTNSKDKCQFNRQLQKISFNSIWTKLSIIMTGKKAVDSLISFIFKLLEDTVERDFFWIEIHSN